MGGSRWLGKSIRGAGGKSEKKTIPSVDDGEKETEERGERQSPDQVVGILDPVAFVMVRRIYCVEEYESEQTKNKEIRMDMKASKCCRLDSSLSAVECGYKSNARLFSKRT